MAFATAENHPYLRPTSNKGCPNRKPTTGRIAQMAIMTNRPLGAGFRANSVLADIVGRIAAWNDARVTRKALSQLSDRELDDLGLNRGDIDEIAAGRY